MEVMGLMLGEFVDDYTIVVSNRFFSHMQCLDWLDPVSPLNLFNSSPISVVFSVKTYLRCHRAEPV